jgi:hypothetical protein
MYCLQLVKPNPESVVDVITKSIMYSSLDFIFKFDIVWLNCLVYSCSNFLFKVFNSGEDIKVPDL